ncbi:hypothetical protein MMC17_003107 [Xylographa soralifera]|nr:hypothetical protein [Xylographa soralifera]
MSVSRQPVTKRARTVSTDPKAQQDLTEELSQVADLVEKRRLQNRISQRNYRTRLAESPYILQTALANVKLGNKIRDRLEKLEALVDASAAAEARASDTEKPQPFESRTTRQISADIVRAEPTNEVRPLIQAEQCDITDFSDPWRSLPDFLNMPETELEPGCRCSHMNDMGTPLHNHQMETTFSAPALSDVALAESNSSLPFPELGTAPSTLPSTEVSSPHFHSGPGSYSSERGRSPSTPGTEKTDHKFFASGGPPYQLPSNPTPYPPFGYPHPFQISTPAMPMSPFTLSSNGIESGLRSPGDHDSNCCCRSPQAPLVQQMHYVWMPVPVMSMPTEMAKPQRSPAASSDGHGR